MLLIGSGIPAIQNNSDLSQGLKPAIGGTVERKGRRHRCRFREEGNRDRVAGNLSLIGQYGDVTMNISVTQFVAPPAVVGCNRSVWRQIIDTMIEGPPRTAADEIDEYLARHQHDLSPTLRIELERRHICL